MQPPKFWNKPPHAFSLNATALHPIAKLWQWAGQKRWKNGPHKNIGIPVICVGNVNLGGTGKTPTVIDIAMRLSAMGKVAHIVSKGYKGREQGPILVDPTIHTADDVGDEPLLLAAFAPTWVSKNRQAGALCAKSAGADVIILDDGLQNPALAKALSILVVDTEMGFGNGRVFPSGPLREPLQTAVEKSDMCIAIGPTENSYQDMKKGWPQIAELTIAQAAIEPLQTGMDWTGLHALAFAGIGRPEKFYNTLRGLGAQVVATRSFDDHQKISNSLLLRLENEAWALGAQLVTTEKDAVRLPKEWQQKVLTVPVRLNVSKPDVLNDALKSIFS